LAEQIDQNDFLAALKDPTRQYQVDQTFSLKNSADSLINHQVHTFYAYSGQGSIWLQSNNVQAFKLYLNGKVLASFVATDQWQAIDISAYSKNGLNHLQVSQIIGDETAQIRIKIPYPILLDRTKEYIDYDNFRLIDQLIQAEINHGFTSAQLVVTKNGQIIKSAAYGLLNSYSPTGKSLATGRKVTEDTLYDLASNTKMYATNFALQHLVSIGKLAIDQTVNDFFPFFKDQKSDSIKGKNTLTLRDLLEHQAGFPADPQYHNRHHDPKAVNSATPNANQALYSQKRTEMLEKIIATPLDYPPRTKTLYSDVDYILLGFIVEKVTQKNLDQYLKEIYYEPLNLKHITFNPLKNGFSKNQVAATELNGNTRDGVVDFDNIRKKTIQGEVHDGKAFYSMAGISGHAGLFANARDLAVLTQVMLNQGGYGNHQFFDSVTFDQFVKPKNEDASFGLGWRRQANQDYSWAFSPLAAKAAIGHTGWTGTLTIIDPLHKMSVILLTNKKNSAVINKQKDPNDFVGDHFLTGQYGFISSLAFELVNKENHAVNDSKLVDMLLTKYQFMSDNLKTQVTPDYEALRALLAVIKEREENDIIKNFMATSEFTKIRQFSRRFS